MALDASCEWTLSVSVLLCLAYLTQHKGLEVHLYVTYGGNRFSFKTILFHQVCTHFLCPFISLISAKGHLGRFRVLAIVNSAEMHAGCGYFFETVIS